MKFLALILVFVAVSAKHEQYTGWKSYFVRPQTDDQLAAVVEMGQTFDLDFLANPTIGHEGVALVPPRHQAAFTKALEVIGVPYRIHVDDVVETLRKEDQDIEATQQSVARGRKVSMPYDNYQRFHVYNEYLQDIARRFPDRATLVTSYISFEGRPINVLKISTTNFEDKTKPIIMIDAAIRGRDWIAPPTVTWAIHKLLENVSDTDLVENFDWILIPIANPDGYEFTHTEDRWWKRTRQYHSTIITRLCPGADINKNFPIGYLLGPGYINPCGSNFFGFGPFSEIETRAIRDIVQENGDRIALYISMQAYGSQLLYPWAYSGLLADNTLDLHLTGASMADAIFESQQSHFPKYVVGNYGMVLRSGIGGTAVDWVYDSGARLAYEMRLPGLNHGFNLPARYIRQVCMDTWEGIAVGARKAGEVFKK